MIRRLLALAIPMLAAPIEGEYTVRTTPGNVEITLRRPGHIVAGIQLLQVPKFEPRVERPAGSFLFAQNGKFAFLPDAQFRRQLSAVARDSWDDERLYQMAVRGVTSTYLEGLAATGISNQYSFDLMRRYEFPGLRGSAYILSRQEMMRLQAHGVSEDLLRQMRLSGLDNATVNDMLKLQTHGVNDLDLIRIRAQGMQNPSVDDIVRWKVNGPEAETTKP